MYVTERELQEVAELSLDDPKLASMLVEWNSTKDWGLQDQILCKIMSHIKNRSNPDVITVERN